MGWNGVFPMYPVKECLCFKFPSQPRLTDALLEFGYFFYHVDELLQCSVGNFPSTSKYIELYCLLR
jgi:hypothetical protein